MEAKQYTTNNQEITEEIKEEIKKYPETNDNENTTTQNLQDAAKAVLKRKFIAIQSYLKKQKKISNKQPNLTPKAIRERTKKPQLAEGNIIKIKTEINEKEMKETIAKIDKTKSWFFEKINKIDQPLVRLIKKKGRRLKSTEFEMKKEK